MNSLVLLSGGMDSVIAYYHALQQSAIHDERGSKVHALSIRYGQRHHNEVSCAKNVVAHVPKLYHAVKGKHVSVNLYKVMPEVGSLMVPEIKVKHHSHDDNSDPSFIPYRNALFVTLGAMWMRKLGGHVLVTGLRGGYPDCTLSFEHAAKSLLLTSDPEYPVSLYSPVHRTRGESVELAKSIPGCMDALAYSMTCFEGTEPPCGTCLPCTKRAEGFAEAGVSDPLLVRLAARGARVS